MTSLFELLKLQPLNKRFKNKNKTTLFQKTLLHYCTTMAGIFGHVNHSRKVKTSKNMWKYLDIYLFMANDIHNDRKKVHSVCKR